MNKYIVNTLVLTFALGVGPAAGAQTVFACQYINAAGLRWENNTWVPKNFRTGDPFFLSSVNGELTPQSAADAIGSSSTVCQYHAFLNHSSCTDHYGGYVIFDFNTLRGGRSEIFGSMSNADSRDTLSVSPFVCQEM